MQPFIVIFIIIYFLFYYGLYPLHSSAVKVRLWAGLVRACICHVTLHTHKRKQSFVKMDGPASKKLKTDNGDSYIPIQQDGSNGDGTTNLSLVFSIKERKGELVRSLKPFEVADKNNNG